MDFINGIQLSVFMIEQFEMVELKPDNEIVFMVCEHFYLIFIETTNTEMHK